MKKIVVVDDDPDIRSLLSGVLEPSYAVSTADNGLDGLEMIRRVRPDLVVLDLLMPKMHGFEVCQRIKSDASTRSIKVLISSSKSYQHDINTAKGSGADDYIVKPFEIAAFTKKVDEMIGGQGRAVGVRFWGTRGSLPTPGPNTQRYGGNTPCTELRVGDELIVVDAGTGLRDLGVDLARAGLPVNAHLFIGHTHWDHIQGFPFFVPFYNPNNRFNVYGAHGTSLPFADVLAGQMSPTYFPVAMKDMPAKMTVNELSGPVTLPSGVRVSYHYLNHPGITIGFRFDGPDWSVGYISDHEPYSKLNAKGDFSAKEDAAIAQFVHGCDVLISEAQYTEEEYKLKRSWGHSTFGDVLGLAAAAQVKKLMLFHHDPTHTDAMMDRFLEECRKLAAERGYGYAVDAAREGDSLRV